MFYLTYRSNYWHFLKAHQQSRCYSTLIGWCWRMHPAWPLLLKVLVNEDKLLRTHCCRWYFLGCANWETFIADTKCFWTKSETFFVTRTRNLCPQQMLRARANGETFVSATMCSQQCVLVCQGLKLTKYRTRIPIASKAAFLENYLVVSTWILNGSSIECHEKTHQPFSLSGVRFGSRAIQISGWKSAWRWSGRKCAFHLWV